MFLTHLHLCQFRNYADQPVELTAPQTILVGDNAQGKSNLLEAIELLATLKSHRTSRDGDLVREGHDWGQIRAHIERSTGPSELGLVLRRVGRRSFSRNGEVLRRQLDGLGTLKAVEFSSLDLDLVRGGPERRRTWLDGLVVQLEPIYAHLLGQYQRVLKQRNALLRAAAKRLREGGAPPPAAEWAIWDAQLVAIGTRLVRRRARAIALVAPMAQQWQATIGQGAERLTVAYQPNIPLEPAWLELDAPEQTAAIQAAFLDRLHQKRAIEPYQGATLAGPHRDEVDLLVDGVPARAYGSQGQQRTLVLALKLAELAAIEAVVGEPPLLLLDDVLAELDLHRQAQLLAAIGDRVQTLITTTHLSAFAAPWRSNAQVLTVRAGHLV